MKCLFAAVALSTLLVPAGFSQKQARRPEEKSQAVKSATVKSASAKSARPSRARDQVSQTFSNVTIAPGQSVALDANYDFTDSDVVRISLRSDNLDLANLQMTAYWSDFSLQFYNATDAIDGSSFVYANVGGAQFLVYGPQFRLSLTNNGTAPMTLDQIMLFAPPVATPN